MRDAPELEGPLYTWPVLLAALVKGENEKPGEVWNTTRVMMAAYDLAPHCSSVHLGQVSRTLERMADAGLVESERVQERGASVSILWFLTDAGRERFTAMADVLARIGALSVRKQPPRKAPRK